MTYKPSAADVEAANREYPLGYTAPEGWIEYRDQRQIRSEQEAFLAGIAHKEPLIERLRKHISQKRKILRELFYQRDDLKEKHAQEIARAVELVKLGRKQVYKGGFITVLFLEGAQKWLEE